MSHSPSDETQLVPLPFSQVKLHIIDRPPAILLWQLLHKLLIILTLRGGVSLFEDYDGFHIAGKTVDEVLELFAELELFVGFEAIVGLEGKYSVKMADKRGREGLGHRRRVKGRRMGG